MASASVRVRTTAVAVLVVAIAMVAGSLLLVLLLRDSLRDGVETSAEQRAEAIADQVRASGPPESGSNDDDEADDLDDVVWQVTQDGRVVASSQPLREALPTDADGDDVSLPGGEARYLLVTEEAGEYDVTVAASLEDVTESTQALAPLLLVGVPVVLLLVGATTWVVATRALAPVERIRREVDRITGDQLERRVPEPPSRDEVNRLARTMNEMLDRLQHARDRQREFVADASHELRSPLTSILQASEISRTHPGAISEAEVAETIREESLRMQRLIDQLLLLTRADEGVVVGQRHEVDLDDVVLTHAARVRRPGLEVDTSGVEHARMIGDESVLSQAVRNLVDNAGRHARTRVRLSLTQQDGWAELVVEDDGSGVPEADHERVFERFVRLDEARDRDAGGSGLGLAIVREAVTAHGGTVRVEDGTTGGARFVVRLPATPQPAT